MQQWGDKGTTEMSEMLKSLRLGHATLKDRTCIHPFAECHLSSGIIYPCTYCTCKCIIFFGICALYSWARKKKDVVYSDQRGETTVVIIPLVHCGTGIMDKDSSMGNLLRYLADAELRKQWMSFRESFISPFIILIKLLHLPGSTYPYHSYAIYIYIYLSCMNLDFYHSLSTMLGGPCT